MRNESLANILFTRRTGWIALGLFVVLVLAWRVTQYDESTSFIPLPFSNKPSSSTYQFGVPESDVEFYDGLSDSQCTTEFPDLYYEIDRAISFWKGLGHTITADDVRIRPQNAAIRVLIHRNEMRILESRSSVDLAATSPDRALGVLHLFQRTLVVATSIGEILPTVEIAFNFQDDAEPPTASDDTHAFWSFSRGVDKPSHQRLWLMPNFDFWNYATTGSFIDSKRKSMDYDDPFTSKIPEVVWRGNAGFNREIRETLIEVTKDKSWADIKQTNFNDGLNMESEDFCKYAMTVYTEGVTYSGRLKFLMNCKSLLLTHEPQYVTHYSHLLKGSGPDQNCVELKRDWSDLEENVKHYLEHPDEAEKIIENSLRTFRSRYTTRAALTCYIRRAIQGYASVSYTPEIYTTAGNRKKRLRGISYESFIDKPADKSFE